ncbi:CPBP family intramembrane metalloprotease [Christensenellaceae bacterium OttesenSCG-928-K19]|nr:CPBP family intramembrane metalloprotease [Christensenellaceae bacterium OttesenSCG-928-K19]
MANGTLLFLLIAFTIIDLFEVFFFWATGYVLPTEASILLRVLVDIPILFIAFSSARPAPALKLHIPKVNNMVYSIALAFFLYLVLAISIRMLSTAFVSAGVSTSSGNATAEVMNEQPFMIAFLFYCVLAPVTEEVLFRGMLQNAYERRFGWGAFVIAGVLFGLIHGNVLAIVNGIAAGIMLGYLYIKTKSLWCPIVFHGLFNLFAFTLVPDYYIINLPWVLGLFPADTLSYANPVYLCYNLGILAIGVLMCYVLVRLLNRANLGHVARRSSAYLPERGQGIVFLAAVILLGLRVGMNIAASL